MGKRLTSFKLITVDNTVKTDILELRENFFSCDIQYVLNDHARDNLLGKKD
jgi:hypothetical protein